MMVSAASWKLSHRVQGFIWRVTVWTISSAWELSDAPTDVMNNHGVAGAESLQHFPKVGSAPLEMEVTSVFMRGMEDR